MNAQTDDENCSEITLEPILDISAAKPLAEALLGLRGNSLKIDASNVERLGTQCVQVLLSALNTWDVDGKTFSVENATVEFSDTLNVLGIDIPHQMDIQDE